MNVILLFFLINYCICIKTYFTEHCEYSTDKCSCKKCPNYPSCFDECKNGIGYEPKVNIYTRSNVKTVD